MAIWPKRQISGFINQRRNVIKDGGTPAGLGDPSIWHALVIIFLEFFAWGLLTVPIINVLAETFPANKFLMNGFILGIKGALSFLSAPLIGALSDIWGRKFFLILTVFSTCMPIPLLTLSPWWYFALFSISGLFSATFSIVLAYVADITEKDERNTAYGYVSATFGASLVTSPALGAFLSEAFNDDVVVALATAIACLDVFFIMVAVPESLPAKLRHSMDRVTWDSADPFSSLRMVGDDFSVFLLCVVVFLSYLPEAGQFSCFFVYLRLVVGFSPEAVAAYIGIVGIMSVVAQTTVLMLLHQSCGSKRTILFGLVCQAAQLFWYGFGSQYWMMWAAGTLAALSQISYPSVSSYLSVHSDGDKQGTVQGIVTGIRGLCQGLGPAMFGFVFYLFDVDLNSEEESIGGAAFAPARPVNFGSTRPTVAWLDRRPGLFAPRSSASANASSTTRLSIDLVDQETNNALWDAHQKRSIPGPPFVFGACLVTCAIFVLRFLPSKPTAKFFRQSATPPTATSQQRSLLSSGQYKTSSSPPTSSAPPPPTRRYRAGPILDLYDGDVLDDDSSKQLLLDSHVPPQSKRPELFSARWDTPATSSAIGRGDSVISSRYEKVPSVDR